MSKNFRPKNFSFQDFDLIVKKDVLYAVFVKKSFYSPKQKDAKKPNRYGLAKSEDGVTWTDLGDILLPGPKGSWDESLWAGSISKQKDQFVIYYTGVKIDKRHSSCKIGKAYSDDLLNWQKDPANPVLEFDENNPYYSGEPNLAFRDPFFFSYQNKNYILFCGKDKTKPAGKQGCVGLVEETEPNKFEWRPPLYSPGIYANGLECPAIYKIKNKWYLLFGLDKENGGNSFHYAIASSPFGKYQLPKNNKLVSGKDYVCRIVRFKSKLLLYYWSEVNEGGSLKTRLKPTKQIYFSEAGELSLNEINQ